MVNFKAWSAWIAHNEKASEGFVGATQIDSMNKAEKHFCKKWKELADEGWVSESAVTFLQSDLRGLGLEKVLDKETESCPS